MINVLDGCLVHGYGALATGVLTSDNNNVANGDTVTIGSITYTFKTAITGAAYDVLIGANADGSLLNLLQAINFSGSLGTTYSNATTGHPEVSAATVVTAHSFVVTAKRPGTLGNSVGTTKAATSLSWGSPTLTGGSVSKASLGWTKDYTALARGIYRAPAASGGSRCYLEVIDNTPDVSNGAIVARVLGMETVTALGSGITPSSGSGLFANLVNETWLKSASQVAFPQRIWVLFGDDRTFYLFVQAGTVTSAYHMYAFGDHRSLVAGDVTKGFIWGHNTFATPATWSSGELGGAQSPSTMIGHYLQRNWSGVISNTLFGKAGDMGFRGIGSSSPAQFVGSLTIPHAPDGGLYLSPVYIFEGAAGAYTQRGVIRGLYHLLHPLTSFNDGDTFAGAGDLAGRNFMIMKFLNLSGGANGMIAVETTPWAA